MKNFPFSSSTTALLVCICWFPPWSAGLEEFMSGAVPIKEPDNHYPIMYSSVIPLLYKFHLPVWDLSTMKIQFWKDHNNCTDSDNYEAGYPCPIMYHTNILLKDFTSNITHWERFFLSKKNSEQGSAEFLHDPSILWNTEICTSLKIEPHFQGMQANSQQIQKYMEVLTQCAERNGTVFNKKVVNMRNTSIQIEDQYHSTFTSFTADYWKKLTTSSREAVSLVAWTALESALMIHQYAETQKWTHAMESCKNEEIPWSIIDTESLKDMLTSLRKNYLEHESLDYAIPLERITKYFKLPLTDCVFGDDNTLTVRIMIPVVPEEARDQNQFVRFHPIPFITEGKVCTLWDNKASIPFNLGLNGVIPCTCSKSDLFCKGWIADSDSGCLSLEQRNQEACIHALTSDIEQDIVQTCPLSCKDVDPNQSDRMKIIISNDSVNTVKIIPVPVKASDNNLTYVQCLEQGIAMEIHWEPVGAYEMTTPAGCSIMHAESSNGTFVSVVSDISGFSLKHLLPYHWRNGIKTEAKDSTADGDADTLVNRIEKMDGVEPKINFLANKLQQVGEECQHTTNNAILWLLVTLSLVANVVFGIMIFRLNKFTKDIKIKGDRMVYNITSSEDDFPIHDQNMRNPLCPNPGNSKSRNSTNEDL